MNNAGIAVEKTVLGIELGSTRIKAVLIDEHHAPLCSGGYEWENQFVDGIWTYSMEEVWKGLRACYSALNGEFSAKYGAALARPGAIGISAMMHGYLPFDGGGGQLAGFRTWRNTMTEQAAGELSELFQFNIPQRWSIAHLYQAILNGEPHVKDVAFLTTLSGYVHWKLTGEKVIGVGEASGMFPIDSRINSYNEKMVCQFDKLVKDSAFSRPLKDIMPRVLDAGQGAGVLTEEGAKLIDPTGNLKAGIPLCPPEGDAGTGMVATNSVAERTGNISAGTSVFAMLVLEKDLSRMYTEIDMVTTPAGKPVAMVHCNNFTSDLDAWMRILRETTDAFGVDVNKDKFYETLYKKAMDADAAGGGMAAYNYYAGEPITKTDEGRPLFVRMPDSSFNLANFMRTLIFSAMGTLKLGMDILTENENVVVDALLGHGGFFRTEGVGQNLMAAALNAPVSVMESAGEGGAWGIALLAAYRINKAEGETLESYLKNKVFGNNKGMTVEPDEADVRGFAKFMGMYEAGLAAERAAIANLK